MTDYRILHEFPSDMLERIAGFYIDAGWVSPEEDTSFLLPALKGSFLVAGAFCENKIAGIARALSDGCSDAYIQDVVVSSEYRGQGIGRGLVNLLTDELRAVGVDWIALVGEPGTEGFYRSIGWSAEKGYTMWRPDKKDLQTGI